MPYLNPAKGFSEESGVIYEHAGAPTNGVNGTFATAARPGSILIDVTNGLAYQNTNTQASPTWTLMRRIAQQANVPAIGATTNLTAVPGAFADLAAVQTYLAGANVVPRIESRLDTAEGKIDALIAALIAAGVISA